LLLTGNLLTMGVPALFRWLAGKYPKIVEKVVEEQPVEIHGVVIPPNISKPNPNGIEFDNLYLDMNGIIHPCCHPDDKPAPATEDEMIIEVFKYTERIINMIRPRKILYLAIDGVAPRAKMNQQRSRRFRTAKESKEKLEEETRTLSELEAAGKIHTTVEIKKEWDSNCITPGTPFMAHLATCLRYWLAHKLNTDPGWKNLKAILSDANVPGEGEHKIMEFIRSQRASPDHDPNTCHVIYGLDADLIMLSLGTHEPHFKVLREDVFFKEGLIKGCFICGQTGHQATQCTGKAKEKQGDFDEKSKSTDPKPYVFLDVQILREYLEIELEVPLLPFRPDFERSIDDWVFLCFFVGNDFLPHLPSLEIREGAIDTLTSIWKKVLPEMGGYLTKNGEVNLERAQVLITQLGYREDQIFRDRHEREERREHANKRRKLQEAVAKNIDAPPEVVHSTKKISFEYSKVIDLLFITRLYNLYFL
ncbi:5203_t:CDS:10, partial [Ambispora leptoticha]